MVIILSILSDNALYLCQSISKGFRVTDLNSRVDAWVVTNVDGQTDEQTENWIPISRQT